MYKAMFVYPWDLVDEGVDRVVGLLTEAGINTIALSGAYHAGKFLRPHAPTGRVYFPDDGTIYFRPNLGRYGDTPLKPLVNALVERTDPFAALIERRLQTGIDIAAWIVCLHNARLGFAHPEYVARNAYDNPYYYSLCPSHAEVQAYLLAVLTDLSASYDVQHVILETPGFLPYEHGFHHEFSLVEPNDWTAALQAICFCAGCRRLADTRGLDGAHLADTVRRALDAFHQHEALPRPSDRQALHWLLADLVQNEEFAPFLRARMDLVTSLVRQIRETLPHSIHLSVIPSVNQPLALAWLEGSDLAALARTVEAVEVLGYRVDPEEVRADLWWARQRIGNGAGLHVALRPAYPDAPDEANLRAKVQAALQIGVKGISFYNYGHIRQAHLAWVTRALDVVRDYARQK